MTDPGLAGIEGQPSCAICNGTGTLFKTFGSHRLFRCGTCSSLFYSPFIPHDKLEYPWESVRWYLERGANLLFYTEIAGLADTVWTDCVGVSRPPRMLEIGCSYGFLADLATRLFGWSVIGADPDAAARQGAAELGLEIINAPLETLPAAEKYDITVAVQVIEHVDDPGDFARQLFLRTADDGIVLLTTPDALFDDLGAEYHPGDHRVLFSRKGIVRILANAGFQHCAFYPVSLPQMICVAATKHRAMPDGLQQPSQEVIHKYLETYLAARIESDRASSALRAGLRFRHFELLVNSGRYAEAEKELSDLEREIGFREDEPVQKSVSRITEAMLSSRRPEEYQRAGPGYFAPFLFYRGILCLNHRADRSDAAACFEQSFRLFRHEVVTFGLLQYEPLLRTAEHHAGMFKSGKKSLRALLLEMFRKRSR